MRRKQGVVIANLHAEDIQVGDNQLALLYPDLAQQLAKLSSQTRFASLLFSAGYRTQEIAAARKTNMAIKHLISRGHQRLRAWSIEP